MCGGILGTSNLLIKFEILFLITLKIKAIEKSPSLGWYDYRQSTFNSQTYSWVSERAKRASSIEFLAFFKTKYIPRTYKDVALCRLIVTFDALC